MTFSYKALFLDLSGVLYEGNRSIDGAADLVKSAIDAGLQACLVRTGKFQAGDEEKVPAGARVIKSVAELLGYRLHS